MMARRITGVEHIDLGNLTLTKKDLFSLLDSMKTQFTKLRDFYEKQYGQKVDLLFFEE